MATEKDKNEVTAEELFDKLVGKPQDGGRDKPSPLDTSYDADLDSDSDLDINELLQKYLPELEGDDDVTIDDTAEEGGKISIPFGEGVLTEYELDDPDDADGEDDADLEPAEAEIEEETDESEKTRDFLDKLLGMSSGGESAEEEVVETTTESAADEVPIEDEYAIDTQMPEEPDELDGLDEIEPAADTAEDVKNELAFSDSLFSTADGETLDETAEEEESVTEDTVTGDPLDINLMIAFDMDGEEDEVSAEAKKIGDKFETLKTDMAPRKFELDRPEYVDKSQTAEIMDEYKRKKISLTVRTILCAAVTVLLFIFENITSLTGLFTGSAKQFSGAFDPALYPVVYIMVSLQLMLLACLCAIPEIITGIKSLLKGFPRPESMTGALAVSGIIYSAVICNLIVSPNEPRMFNFAVAVAALLTLIAAVLDNKREMMNFRIISNKKAKHVVRRMQEEESICEVKAFDAADDEICDVMKIEKTNFVDGFFTRLRTPVQNNGTAVMFLMGASVVIGVLFGVFASLRAPGDSASAWSAAFSAMYLVAPMSILFAFSYPFYRANRAAKEYDSAIIGESSLEEYSNASIISFDDKNVFPSYAVKVQNIKIYNNARIDRVLYYASSVFSYAGGPLQDVFEITTKDMGTSENVRIFESEDGFLATQVDGVNIIFGSYDALVDRGLEIPEKAAGDDVDLSNELSIMYMFRESVLVAKMYIKYDMDEDIDVILKQFSGDGLYVCVRTFDPNIDERMIAHKLGDKRIPLKIIRYLNPAEVGKFEEKVDSGLVTCSSSKSLLQVISYCERVVHTKKTNVALGVLSVMIGAAIMLLLLLANSMSSLSSLIIVIYQLIWLIPTMIASKMFIR